jgi:hypothetical protein
LQGAQITPLYFAKDELMELTLGIFCWFSIIKIFNFAKGIMPKIFVELNLDRKYSNPHLNLNT